MTSTMERKNSIGGDFRKRQNSRTTEKESETLSKITNQVRKISFREVLNPFVDAWLICTMCKFESYNCRCLVA